MIHSVFTSTLLDYYWTCLNMFPLTSCLTSLRQLHENPLYWIAHLLKSNVDCFPQILKQNMNKSVSESSVTPSFRNTILLPFTKRQRFYTYYTVSNLPQVTKIHFQDLSVCVKLIFKIHLSW